MARTRTVPSIEEDYEKTESIVEEKVQEETPVPALPKWRFIGGGALVLRDGQRIESNQIFFADPSAISPAFMDLMQLLEPGEVKPKYDDSEILDVEIVKRADGKYDVVAGDVALNDAPLTKAGAKAFVASLSAE
jgi:gentisate 1,2-dioxygenase